MAFLGISIIPGYTGRTYVMGDSVAYVVFVINSPTCMLVAPTRLEWTEREFIFRLS